jgi:hypothetical protein
MQARIAVVAAIGLLALGIEGGIPRNAAKNDSPSYVAGGGSPAAAPQRKGTTKDGAPPEVASTQALTASTPPTDPKKLVKVEEHEFEPSRGWRRPQRSSAAGESTASTTQTAPRSTVAQTIGSTNVLGAELGIDSGFVPPDSMGAAGPTQFLLGVNGRIRTFNKSGSADGILDTTLNNFFGSVGGNSSGTTDPRVRYDRVSGRWFVTAITTPASGVNNKILLAVSSGGNITNTSTWRYFTIPADSGTFADFDTLGIDEDALYIGVNVFDIDGELVNTYGYVVTKSSVLGTGAIHYTVFRSLLNFELGVGPYSPEGVDNLDRGTNQGYFIGVDGFEPNQLDIVRVNNPGAATPTISPTIVVPTAATTIPLEVEQPSPGPPLDAGDLPRLGNAVIRKGRLWTSHSMDMKSNGTVSANPFTDPGGREGIRWYELKNLTTTPAVNQSGVVHDSSGSSPFSYWMSSIMVSGQGHAAMGFSRASTDPTTGFVGAGMTGRLATYATGVMDAVTLLQGGTATYAPTTDPVERWGDYSYTSVDPTDDMTMWTVQEYVTDTDTWGVRVVQLKAPAPTFTSAGTPSVGLTSTPLVVNGTGFFDPGSGFSKRLTASATGSVTVNSVSSVSPTKVILDVSTASATAGDVTLTITNPDGQTAAGTVTLNAPQICETVYCADFNSDGKPDVFWRNRNTGANAVWFLNGSQLIGSLAVTTVSLDWVPVHGADFNGDGKPDIFWHNKKTGANSIWLMNGTTRTSSLTVDRSVTGYWTAVATGDFNNDTNPDVLWHNTSTHANSVWFMDGGHVTSFGALSKKAPSEWIPYAARDANGNTTADVYWFNRSTGASSIWLMNGTTYAGSVGLDRRVSTSYEPAMVEDANGDLKGDVFWHHKKTGQLVAWFMSGANSNVLQTFATVGTAAVEWKPY